MVRFLAGVLLLIGVSSVISNAPAQDEPAVVTDAEKKTAADDFRALEKQARELFVKCKNCRGRGKVKDRTCRECLGHRRVFDGEYQKLLDHYIEHCDTVEKHAAVLDTDTALANRVRATRDWHCNVISNEMGPQKNRPQNKRGATARYERSTKRDGKYDRLAFEVLVGKEPPADRAMAFEGRVAKILEKDGQTIAEVRFSVGSYRSRTCWVLVPDGIKWKEYGEAKVIGKVIAASEQRKRFELGEDVVIVKAYHGTR